MRTVTGQVVHTNTPVYYSTGMLDILIVTVINWTMRTIMEQVVCTNMPCYLQTGMFDIFMF